MLEGGGRRGKRRRTIREVKAAALVSSEERTRKLAARLDVGVRDERGWLSVLWTVE